MAKYLVEVQIAGDATKVKAALAAANIQVTNFQKKVTGFSGVAANFKKNWLGITAAMGTFIIGTKKVIAAAAYQEKQETLLAAAMKQAGTYTEQAYTHNLKYAASLQKMTIFGDEAILGVQKILTNFGVEGEMMDKLTKATLDLAAAKGMDLKSAADLVSKSVGSSTNALSRYGIQITGAVGSTERMQQAVENITKLYGGAAQAEAATFSGQITQMKMAIGDAAEEIGKVLIPILLPLAKAIKKIAELFSALPSAVKTGTVIMIASLAALGVAVKVLGISIKTAFPWMAIVSIAITAISLLIANWDKVKTFFVKLGAAIKNTMSILWTNIKIITLKGATIAIEIVQKMLTPYIFLVNQVIKLYNKLRGANIKSLDQMIDDTQGAIENKIKQYENELKELKEIRKKDVKDHEDTEEEKKKIIINKTEEAHAALLKKAIEARQEAQRIKQEEFDITLGFINAELEEFRKADEKKAEIQKKEADRVLSAINFQTEQRRAIIATTTSLSSMGSSINNLVDSFKGLDSAQGGAAASAGAYGGAVAAIIKIISEVGRVTAKYTEGVERGFARASNRLGEFLHAGEKGIEGLIDIIKKWVKENETARESMLKNMQDVAMEMRSLEISNQIDSINRQKKFLTDQDDAVTNQLVENFKKQSAYIKLQEMEEKARIANMSENERRTYNLKKQYEDGMEKLLKERADARAKIISDAEEKVRELRKKEFENQKKFRIIEVTADMHAALANTYNLPINERGRAMTSIKSSYQTLINEIKKIAFPMARGGEIVTNGRRLLLVGDNPSGKERVTVTPLNNSGRPTSGGRGAGGGMIIERIDQLIVQANNPQEMGNKLFLQMGRLTGSKILRRG